MLFMDIRECGCARLHRLRLSNNDIAAAKNQHEPLPA
jgi:hypothetical protein